MGGRCAHFSNYMGPWCLTNSDYIGGGVRPISNSVGGCIAFAASRRGKNIICKSPCCALFVFRDALPFCQLECPLSVSFTYADLCLLPWGIYACVTREAERREKQSRNARKPDRVSDQAVCATTEDSLRLGILYWKQKTLNSCTADLRFRLCKELVKTLLVLCVQAETGSAPSKMI